jgi:SAM-dependent methyltransferase
MESHVTEAYASRAEEYTSLLGSMGSVHPEDRDLVVRWAEGCDGTVVDAGCGPGHWTDHLAGLGIPAIGIDAVPWFIDHAVHRAPGRDFRLRPLEATGLATGTVAGVLAWYSLIHHEPGRVPEAIAEFDRILRPGGTLLVGFFDGPELEPFDHAVTTAYRWPVDQLEGVLVDGGFTVTDVRHREDPGHRPHASISAVRR